MKIREGKRQTERKVEAEEGEDLVTVTFFIFVQKGLYVFSRQKGRNRINKWKWFRI